MKISYYADYMQMSEQAKALIVNHLQKNKDSLLCAATGNSPLMTYHLLAAESAQNPSLFESLRILKLDEWGGVEMNEPQTCESFLQQNVLKPLKISADRYFTFDSTPSHPPTECARMQAILQREGPIDLCILGLGRNGHIGFNEPADALQPNCHVAKLSADSMQHTMAKAMPTKPTYGMTLGMSDILQSKKIILLITGSNKKTIIKQLLKQKITTQLPASFLWLHPDTVCLIDHSAMEM